MMRELDIVALTVDLPNEHLKAGDTGTIVLECQGGYVVEFMDDEGDTTAVVDVLPSQIRVVTPYQPAGGESGAVPASD